MKNRIVITAILIASVIGIYSIAINAPFQFDDDAGVVLNASIQNIRDIKAILFFKPELPRPLFNLSLAIDYAIYGLRPWGYRVTNLIIHLISIYLVWRLALRVNRSITDDREGNPTASGMAAFIFALHPLSTEPTIYIWSRSSSMMTMFSLASILTYLAAFDQDRGVSPKKIALSFAAFVAALLSKEEALTLPALLLAVDMIVLPADGRKKRLVYSIPFWLAPVVAAVYRIILKVTMYDVVSWRTTEADEFGELVLSHGVRGLITINFSTQLKAGVYYIIELVWPIHQSVDHGVAFDIGTPSFGAIMGALLLAAMAVIFFFKRKSYPRAALFAAFFVVPLGLFYLVPVSDVMVERRLYLPLAGFAIMLGWALDSMKKKYSGAKAAIAFTIIPLILLGALSANRALVWRDKIGLWNDAVRVSPDKLRPRVILARLMYESGNVYRAIHENLAAIRIKENHSPPIVNLGVIYMNQGAYGTAERYFRQAVHWHPGSDFNARFNLAIALSKQGKDDEAVKELLETIRINSGHALAMQEIGRIYAQHGDPATAIGWFKKALDVNPELAQARMNLGMTLIEMGRGSEGLAELEKAAATDPRDGLILFNLGFAYLGTNRVSDAIAAFTKGANDQTRPECLFGLAQALAAQGMNREAAAALGKFISIVDLRQRPELAPMVENAKKTLGI